MRGRYIGRVRGKRVELAPEEKIRAYRPEVDRVLEAIGFPPHTVLVTDESRLSDFPLDELDPGALRELLGREPHPSEYIWHLAQQLHEHGRAQ